MGFLAFLLAVQSQARCTKVIPRLFLLQSSGELFAECQSITGPQPQRRQGNCTDNAGGDAQKGKTNLALRPRPNRARPAIRNKQAAVR